MERLSRKRAHWNCEDRGHQIVIGGSASHRVRYRAEIDGLRAVAVLSVIAFHLWPKRLVGGYLGVDIFFILSGFLITSIIWREIGENDFSIVRFYDRRIRRIMPALLLILVIFTPIAAVLLLPSDLIGYAKSLIATLGFSANFYFWRDTDYFARTAEDKPLLHLWSLGVEEQFYIVFPLLLALLWRWRPQRAFAVLAVLAAASLGLDAMALVLGADSTAFFLLPTRAWELAVGAMLALRPQSIEPTATSARWMAFLGAFFVVASLGWAPQPLTALPVALPCAVGVVLIILACRRETSAANRVLRVPPLRLIGLVSYSLYLWHWPVIVFSQYYLVRKLDPFEALGALAAMTICAVISWHYVEKPFRRLTMPIRKLRYAALAGVGSLAIAGALLLASAGLPRRLEAAAAVINGAVGSNYRCPISDFIFLGKSRACLLNLPSRDPEDADVMLLGNSHAQMYAPLWASILRERGQTGVLVPANGCLPTVQVNITRGCVNVARQNLAELDALHRAQIVILGFDWVHGPNGLVDADGRKVDNRRNAALLAGVDDLIEKLRSSGKQIVLIGPIAEPGWDVPSVIGRELAFGRPIERPTYTPETDFLARYGDVIRHFEGRPDLRLARPDRVQCTGGRCNYIVGGRSLFADHGHIAAGELYRFRGAFEAALPAGDQVHFADHLQP